MNKEIKGCSEDSTMYKIILTDGKKNKMNPKKEAKKIFDFVGDNFHSDVRKNIILYAKSYHVEPSNNYFNIINTDKICDCCDKIIKKGTVVRIDCSRGRYQLKFFHLELCSLKNMKQRLQENICADAPKIILEKYYDAIYIIEKAIRNKEIIGIKEIYSFTL